MADSGVMNPEAGVTAARPTTIPVAIPRVLGLPSSQESTIHTRPAVAAEVLVVRRAFTATPFAAKAEPALKPNQPTHRSPVPRTVRGMLLGSIGAVPKPLRGPMTSAKARAEKPAAMCTTVPPAKSRTPMFFSHPP